MLRIDSLKLPIGADDAALRRAAARTLRIGADKIGELRLLRRSIDAREGVTLVCCAAAAAKASRAMNPNATVCPGAWKRPRFAPS